MSSLAYLARLGRRRSASVNLGAMQLPRTQAITHVGRSGRKVPQWLMVGDVVAPRRRCGCRCRSIVFPSLDPDSQVVTAST